MTISTVTQSVRDRITVTLFASQSLFSAGMIATFTLTAIIAADLSNNDAMAGIPSTLSLMGRAIAAYPLGLLLERSGRRIGLSAGFGMAILGCIITIWAIMAGSFLGFCVGATLLGMGRASGDQSRYVAAEVHFVDRRAKVIGLIVFAGTIGAVLGPAIVAPSQAIASGLGWAEDSGPFFVAALLYFLAMMVLMLFLRPDPKDISQTMEKEEEGTEKLAPPRPLSLIFQQPTTVLAVASISIGQLVMSLMMVITPLHMSHYDHSTQSISFVLSAHTLGMFALSGVTGWLIDRYGRVPLIVAGAFTLLAASIMAPQVTAVIPLAFALFLLGLGWNFTFIAGSSLLADSLAANERARTQGVTETFAAIAAASAGLVTGFLFDWAGMMAVGAVSLAFSLGLVGFFVYYAMSRVWVHQPKPSNQ